MTENKILSDDELVTKIVDLMYLESGIERSFNTGPVNAEGVEAFVLRRMIVIHRCSSNSSEFTALWNKHFDFFLLEARCQGILERVVENSKILTADLDKCYDLISAADVLTMAQYEVNVVR